MLTRGVLYVAAFLVCALVCAKSRSRALRQITLLTASYVIYIACSGWLTAVIVASTLMNFLFGRWLRKSESRSALALGILANLLILASFKYFPQGAVSLPFASLQRFAHLALPLGISFWTFQAMSFLFDLYRGEELDPTLVEFALYMAFFPVTISGPVCRMPDMLAQFRRDEPTSGAEIRSGFVRIATGVLMMQIARLLGQGILANGGVDQGFDVAKQWGGTDVWCLAFGYGLQLFFDFAGYSHIAIGAAQALGFTVPENFQRPFSSTSPSVFWTRWHMSLSFWIRDYVFLPLAVLRREIWWRNAVLVLSMVIFGLWHRASWLFLIWGAYHGLLLLLHRLGQNAGRKWNWNMEAPLWTPLSWAATMGLISVGWIFFRANSLLQAREMLTALLSPARYSSHFLGDTLYALVVCLAVIYALTLAISDAIIKGEGLIVRNRWLWVPALYIVLLVVMLLVNYSHVENTAQFMYRNF